ncbi:redoxin domain-containing protein [Halalkalibacter flavus]|uniref:redoxin domain-containing protein n=1 Tax=Halalkalibacter flavus TaxID=3090668 RepID=UPI002FC9D9B1
MDGIWTVGPLIIKQAWLMLAFLFVVGFLLSSQLVKDPKRPQVAKEVYWNSIVYFFLAYQLSSLFVYPMIAIVDPIAVLAMPSGTNEWLIAWGVIAIYVFWKTRKEHISSDTVFLPILVTYLVLETIYFSFYPFSSDGNPVSFYQTIVNLILLFLFYFQQQKSVSAQLIVIRLAILYGLSIGVLSLILQVRMFDAAVPSWFYFLICFIGLVSSKKIRSSEGTINRNTKKGLFTLFLLIGINGWGSLGFLDEAMLNQGSKETLQIAVGQTAPEFVLQSLEGKEISLSDFKGQRVMINFWATWCPPCRAEMPDMEKFYTNHEVVLLAVNGTNTEGSRDHVKDFVSNLNLTFPVLLDEHGEIASLYQIGPIPTSLFIDKNGIISDIHIGAMNEEMMIRKLQAIK